MYSSFSWFILNPWNNGVLLHATLCREHGTHVSSLRLSSPLGRSDRTTNISSKAIMMWAKGLYTQWGVSYSVSMEWKAPPTHLLLMFSSAGPTLLPPKCIMWDSLGIEKYILYIIRTHYIGVNKSDIHSYAQTGHFKKDCVIWICVYFALHG